MSEKLISLVKRGNAKAFHQALRDRLEKNQPISLEGATFQDLTLTGFDFSEVDLTHCAFENCTLSETRFVDAILDGAFFDAVTLLRCHFEGGSFDGWAIDASTLGRCTFKELSLNENEWTDCRLNDSLLLNVTSDSWLMERVTFQAGKWEQVEVEEGEWVHVTLRDLTVNEWTLGEELEIRNSYYVDSTLVGAQWPKGFIEKSGRRKAL